MTALPADSAPTTYDRILARMQATLPDVAPDRLATAFWRAVADAEAPAPRLRVVRTPARHLSAAEAIEQVALYCTLVLDPVTPSDIVGDRRSKTVVRARQIAMWVVREITGLSLPQMGAVFGRDHTTIAHGIRAAVEREGVAALAEIKAWVTDDPDA